MLSHSHSSPLPLQLKDSFGAEESEVIKLENPQEQTLFWLLHTQEQHVDQYYACLYIEKMLKTKNIYTFSVADMIHFIKTVHGIAASALMIIKQAEGKAGELLSKSILVSQETGIPNQAFTGGCAYSEKNWQLLKKIYGIEVANSYKDFFPFLYANTTNMLILSLEDLIEQALHLIEANPHDPRCLAYQKVEKIIDASKSAERMQAFCAALVSKIAAKEDPVQCATFALFNLIDGHFFPHGNRRTARIIANWILKALGHEVILIPAEAVSEYYIACEKSSATNLKPLLQVMRKYATQTQAMDLKKNLRENFFPTAMRWDNFIIINYSDRYEVQEYNETEFKNTASETTKFFNQLIKQPIDRDFFLNQAKKYSKGLPEVAQFYYERSKRLKSCDSKKSLDLDAIAQLLKINRQKTPVIIVGPDETARLTDKKEVGFWLQLERDHLAVIFKDKVGNISVTHIDPDSTMDFLLEEKKIMQGEYTLDIVRHDQANSARDVKLLEFVNKFLGDVKNSKGKKEVRKTKRDCILIHNGNMFMFEPSLLKDISPVESSQKKDMTNHLLCGYEVQEAAVWHKLRFWGRLTVRSVSRPLASPVIVFHNSWTGNYSGLTKNAANLIQEIAVAQGHPAQIKILKEEVENAQASQAALSLSLEEQKALPKAVINYATLMPRTLFFNLQIFFNNKNNPNLPNSALECIASYAEAQDEAVRRILG